MNCEQVEELLSAYLDDTLALGETAEAQQQLQREIATHLENCMHCSTVLADYRRFDTLLAQLPRVSPSPALRDTIFSSSEYLELTGTDDKGVSDIEKRPTAPYKSVRRDTPGRPQLVALPGGRRSSSPSSKTKAHPAVKVSRYPELPPSIQQRRHGWGLRLMQVAIAATILLTLGVGSLIGWNLWMQKNSLAGVSNTITPPAGPEVRGPLPAGMHYVFLRDGALWSMPADASTPAQQLTPQNVTVAANWVVSPPLPGHSAGDMLAYIDLQRAQLHTIRSDGQSDTIVQQSLLPAGVNPASIWDTETGQDILNSLAWSADASMLTFVAATGSSTNTSVTNLYIFSRATGTVQLVPLPMKGSASTPVWSPDGVRVAFEVDANGVASILDYNTQNHGLLVITPSVSSPTHPNDTVLSLNWSPSITYPAITWSVGDINQVHGIWLRHVGPGGSAAPQALLLGAFTQATYSRGGHGGAGSWLLVSSYADHAANLWRMDVTPGALAVQLTSGKQVGFAEWSPDGAHIAYLDNIMSNVGTLHVVDVSTQVDTSIAKGATNQPVPSWSGDGQQLAYSTGTQIVVAHIQARLQLEPLKLHGLASAFAWFATSSQQLVVAVSDGQQGVYLIDTQHNAAHLVDQQGISGPILWTQVP